MGFLRWLFGRQVPFEGEQEASASVQMRPSLSRSVDGRRRLEDIPYMLPKDIEEGERLNLQHYLLRNAIKANYMAPLEKNIGYILDVGCGTGIWGYEMANAFPDARVFGLDLEPPQTVSLAAHVTRPPSNYHFVQGNILKGLPFPDHNFDFTHQRMLVLAIPTNEWPGVIGELRRVTRVGGWVELLELGETLLNAGPISQELFGYSHNFLLTRGIDSRQMEKLGTWMIQMGLRHVKQHNIDIPLGAWDKHAGVLLEKDILAAFRALGPILCQSLRIAPLHYNRLLEQVPAEWKKNRVLYRFHLAYGQVGR